MQWARYHSQALGSFFYNGETKAQRDLGLAQATQLARDRARLWPRVGFPLQQHAVPHPRARIPKTPPLVLVQPLTHP